MIVLKIILLLLKIIGITLLAILGLAALLVCLILFVPIRYEVEAKYIDNKPDIRFKISYLLHIFRIFFESNLKDTDLKIKILFFELSNKNRKKPKAQKNNSIKKKQVEDSLQTDESEKEIEFKATEDINEVKPETIHEINSSIEPDEKQSEKDNINSAVSDKKKSEHKDKDRKKSDAKNKKEKTNSGSDGIMDKIKGLTELIKENKPVISFLLKQLKKIFKHILPGTHVINIKLGLDDPALLGEITGAIAVIRAATNIVINITPCFGEKIIEADIRFKGRIRLVILLFIALRVYFNKDVKRIIRTVRG